MAQSTQPYLYAVSAPVKQDSAKYHYADLNAAQEQKPSKTNAKNGKARRAPQPLPHQKLKVKESLLVDPNLRRPLSLNDLRPPPTSPPPPLPKHGKLAVNKMNFGAWSLNQTGGETRAGNTSAFAGYTASDRS